MYNFANENKNVPFTKKQIITIIRIHTLARLAATSTVYIGLVFILLSITAMWDYNNFVKIMSQPYHHQDFNVLTLFGISELVLLPIFHNVQASNFGINSVDLLHRPYIESSLVHSNVLTIAQLLSFLHLAVAFAKPHSV